MRFGVLGPLAVWTADGGPVRIPEAKVRALLADLLAHAGQVVSVDRLVEDLWGEHPPGRPEAALQTKVWQLRRAMGKELVLSRAPGYVLQAPADAIDAHRFQTLTTEARASADPRTRAALLSDALALWRGEAFADFRDEEFARSAVLLLEEQRLTALEEQAEARLELGEHSLLVGELGDLVREHPLRERLRAAHLRALYRAGRQSEALDSYGDLRDRLLAELGLDPSPELAALQRAILGQDPGLDAPAAPTSRGRPHTNLPAPLTDLVGRSDAVAQVRGLLGGARRLVTLTGPGGVGKTRLALEAAARLAGSFPDGVWLAELTGLDRTTLPVSEGKVVEVVSAALGLRDDDAAGPADRLVDALRAKRTLLVLDNCEHVIEPVAALAERLLRAAPELRVLATSQEPLGISGELLWAVPPLGRESAVRLFVARAADAAPGFAPGPGDTEAVEAICRRLDGLPLALELAATRVRALGVRELAARLDDRFRVLAAGQRGAPARQQTLRAMIDWSWELLSPAEQVVLRRLAVHADGCTLEAAEAVCAEDGLDVLDLLARLVDRSLVVTVETGTGRRYRLLESVAAYCVERLAEAGELETVRRRHHGHYTELAVRAELRGHGQRQWLERLDTETPNLRAALETAARLGDGEAALRLANALTWYWFLRGRLGEGVRSLRTALSVDGGPGPLRAVATLWQAGFVLSMGEGSDLSEQGATALRLAEEIGEPGERARTLWFLTQTLSGSGDLTASGERQSRVLADFERLGDRWGVAAALASRSGQARLHGDFATVERDGGRSLALFRELGDRWGQLQATHSLAALAEITEDYPRAARLHREGLRVAEELGLWTDVSSKLSGLGRIALLTGDLAAAADFHERARRLAAEQSHRNGEHFAEVGLALGARRRGELDRAEAHLVKWLDWLREVDGQPGTALVMAQLGFIAEQRGDAERAMTLHLEGMAAARLSDDPLAIALATEGLAGAHALAGRHGQAARLLGSAAATRDSVGAPLPRAERIDVDRISDAVRLALGEEAFAAEFARGSSRPIAVVSRSRADRESAPES